MGQREFLCCAKVCVNWIYIFVLLGCVNIFALSFFLYFGFYANNDSIIGRKFTIISAIAVQAVSLGKKREN